MINLLIMVVMAIGMVALAIDANAWPVWAVILLVLVVLKYTSKWGNP